MIEQANPSERAMPVSPQLALRVAILGGIALVLFTVVFFRLWYLQILSGSQYRAQADVTSRVNVPIAAPRGAILDETGRVIAGTEATNAVQIVPALLPPEGAARDALYARLGRVLGMTGKHVEALVIRQRQNNPYANATIAVNTGFGILTYLSEHEQLFPGVTEGTDDVRQYPQGDLAASTLGWVGLINADEEKNKAYAGIEPGSIIGQSGLEGAYDQYLRGTPGVQPVRVDAAGNLVRPLQAIPPTPGDDLRLTINLGLEEAGDSAMAQGMGLAQALGNPAPRGAFVVLDPRDGAVLAMDSFPSYDPAVFTQPELSTAEWNTLRGTNTQPGPLFNLAVEGEYPTGSTFKPITALAGLKAGLITPSTLQGTGSCVEIGDDHQPFCNANNENDGNLDVTDALSESEDTFFYLLGARANDVSTKNKAGIIQNMAYYLGLGKPTGIDLPGEASGVIPDAAWRAKRVAEEQACEARNHGQSCGIASDDREWTVGDNVGLAVGQGDLLATPLQMAVVYSALASAYENGGNGAVPQPYLAKEIDSPTGALLQELPQPSGRRIHLDEGDLDVVMQGLRDATSQPGGTSADVWKGFPLPVYGKTGTAQHASGEPPQAWYVCYLPGTRTRSPLVIAVTIEQGGYGDQSAAPVARLIASEWFHVKAKLVAGSSPDQ